MIRINHLNEVGHQPVHEGVLEWISLDRGRENAEDAHEAGAVLVAGGLEGVVHRKDGSNRVLLDVSLKITDN